MNYLTETRLFYTWLETHPLTPASITLWHGLMFIANRSGWQRELNIPISRLEATTYMTRASIYRERERLKQANLIDYKSRGGRASSIYVINSFELHFVSHSGTQSDTQSYSDSHFVSQYETQSANIYKLNYISNKENIKRKIEVAGEPAPLPINSTPERKEKSCAKKEKKVPPHLFEVDKWLSGLEPTWQELMQTWLEYKQSRKERYKSEMSVSKCLAQLQKLSANNPQTAQQIIDQSIANNWAGLFELKRQPYYPRGAPTPARGQHVGQIIHPESEEKRQRILANFGKRKE